MNLQLMFPKDYFTNEVESDFKTEYETAMRVGFPTPILIDEWAEEKYTFDGNARFPGVVILYRGWMKHISEYISMIVRLEDWSKSNLRLLVPWQQYEHLHYFTHSYGMIKDSLYTPPIFRVHWHGEPIEMSDIKLALGDYFMMKDEVKSVKGSDFPTKISTSIDKKELEDLMTRFRHLRGKLYSGDIVLKKYEPLKKYGEFTNEYRVFYFLNEAMTIEPNSNQPADASKLPLDIVQKVQNLPSPFYTVDFAEMENGEWMVVETGDGQVSGLGPNQNPFVFYSKLKKWSNSNV